jgi:hypothetical protein
MRENSARSALAGSSIAAAPKAERLATTRPATSASSPTWVVDLMAAVVDLMAARTVFFCFVRLLERVPTRAAVARLPLFIDAPMLWYLGFLVP